MLHHSSAPPTAPPSSPEVGATDLRRSLLRDAIRSFSFLFRLFSSRSCDARSVWGPSSSEVSAELALALNDWLGGASCQSKKTVSKLSCHFVCVYRKLSICRIFHFWTNTQSNEVFISVSHVILKWRRIQYHFVSMLNTTILDKVYRTFVEHEHKTYSNLKTENLLSLKRKNTISLI